MIHEADGIPVINLSSLRDCWAELFHCQFKWPPGCIHIIPFFTLTLWPISDVPEEYLCLLSPFGLWCLGLLERVWWQHVSNDKIRRRISGVNRASLKTMVSLSRPRGLAQVLLIPAQLLSHRTFVVLAGQEWEEIRGKQPTTWNRSSEKSDSILAAVGSCRLPGWNKNRMARNDPKSDSEEFGILRRAPSLPFHI